MDSHPLRRPDPTVHFAARAARFRWLSATRPALAGYLELMAEIADLQHHLAAALPLPAPALPLPGRPLLDCVRRPRDGAWREALRVIAAAFAPRSGPVGAICGPLRAATETELDALADALLAAEPGALEPGAAPFLAAALEVQWVTWASRLDGGVDRPGDAPWLCPVCGARPVAALLLGSGDLAQLRYLSCSLCASEWHRVRSQCVRCGSAERLMYFGLSGERDAIKAEACGYCRGYIKILDRGADPGLDPMADDTASLVLDILMAEQDRGRIGFNPRLMTVR